MKQLRPLSLVLAALALCCWSAAGFACDQNKTKGTSASNVSASGQTAGAAGACTAAMAAQCTPQMSAACAKGMKASNAAMSGDCCAGKASATTAMKGGAPMRTIAMTAGAEGACPHSARVSAMAAGSEGSCAAHGMKNSAMAGGTSCQGKGMVSISGHATHEGCEACGDMDACDQALRNMGAMVRAVPLKNGVMYIYTTDPSKARAVQIALAQRNEQMAITAASGNDAQLCSDCRQMRGAAKSGKLTREIVNIEGGCLALVTSSDAAIVAKIHAMSGVSTLARAKI